MKDLWRIQKAAFSSTRYSITINNEFAGDFWNSFKTRIVYKFLPTLLSSIKLLHREGATPVFITVTDISPGAPLYTDPVPALRYILKKKAKSVWLFICQKSLSCSESPLSILSKHSLRP